MTLFSQDHDHKYIHETVFSQFVISSSLIFTQEIVGKDFIFRISTILQFLAKMKSMQIKGILQ